MKVMVTGTGGPAGVSVVRALRDAGHAVLGVDADPLAVGLRLATQGELVPRYDDDSYVEALADLGRREGVEVLVPTLAEELRPLALGADLLAEAGIRAWLPDPDAVERCIDKWHFAGILLAAGVATPATGLGAAPEAPPPWIVKPRRGRGSRNVVLAEDAEGLRVALATVPEPIVQPCVRGREFTVDALVGPNATVAGAVPRWRLETRGGISTRGTTFRDDRVTATVAAGLAAVGLVGPANVQGFVTDDDQVVLIETNPRFSGGLPLSLAAGAELVGEYLRTAMGLEPRPAHLGFRAGVTMLRYFEEVFEG